MWTYIAIVGCVLVIAAILLFNRLVSLRQRLRGAWSDIDVQLKRRWDLVPSLVATVQGYAVHEKATFEQVAAARQQAANSPAGDPAARGREEHNLALAVRQLFAVAENYPQLRATEAFQQLHRSLVETEDGLQNARRYYNAVVRDFNSLVNSFPTNILAALGGFRAEEFFQVDNDQRAVPEVKL